MKKQADTTTEQSPSDSPYQNVLDALTEATGLQWSPPPQSPSFLQNGYYTETEMVRAPHLVRKLKDAAITATGKPRAILFERSGERNASVNIPKEIAENEKFIGALSQIKVKGAKPSEKPSRPTPAAALKLLRGEALKPGPLVPAPTSDNFQHLQK